MRINVKHDTFYRYEHPVRFSAQYLRLTPYNNPTQRIVRWQISAPGTSRQWNDAFGNICHTLVCDYVTDEIQITATGMVETYETHGVLPMDETGMPVEVFLRTTPLTRIDDRIRDFVQPVAASVASDRVTGLHDLMALLHEKIEYKEGETHVHSTASDVLADGFGVCQDHTHAFISCARALDVPARYVSGYLYTGEDDKAIAASHAWAAAWVENLGWVSFDAANKVSATDCYIGLAFALDYSGACPVRGVRHGGSEDEALEVQLRVAQAQ